MAAFLLAGWLAGFVLTVLGGLVMIPLMFLVVGFEQFSAFAWVPVAAMIAGLFVLFPRFLIMLASTVYLKRIAPFEDLAATGRIWGRAAAVGAMIIATLLLAFIACGMVFRIAGLADDYQSFGAQFDVIYNWALTAPLSAVDGLVLACAMLGASLFWVMARGAAAYAALVLAQADGATPPASSGARGPAPAAA
ncbi:hypothetical protein L2D00_05250 [Hyphomonadaceae bacterium BL14]|nr:hypothetical protein L2D00_05250 [Hyphomonadaceae bacterium BL14]